MLFRSKFREIISQFEIAKFPKLDPKQIDAIDRVLSSDIPALMRLLPAEHTSAPAARPDAASSPTLTNAGETPAVSAASPVPEEAYNPFDEDANASDPGVACAVPPAAQSDYTAQCYNLHSASSKLSGASARDVLTSMGLQKADLRKIWELSDVDKDGALDCEEFILACHLIDVRKRTGKMYDTLPSDLMPPSKR